MQCGCGIMLNRLNYITFSRHKVYICYFDESGDPGVPSATLISPTNWFVLGCVVVEDIDWLDTLNNLVELRRKLRDEHGLPPREELKGSHFLSGEGIFKDRGIGRRRRMRVYRFIMNFQSSLPIRVFSVAVEKQKSAARGWDPQYCAWTFALQRLDTLCRKTDERCMIFPDEGYGWFIRKIIRAHRRHQKIPKHYGPGTISLPTSRILEDPNDRKSYESYFVQLADLNAYSSHRSKYIDPVKGMPRDMWDSLSTEVNDIRLIEVNEVRGGPPGIVKYP